MTARGRLIVVSNRLPVTAENVDGRIRLRSSGGGLVRALVPILNESGGCWIGWPGTDYSQGLDRQLDGWCSSTNYAFHPVFLTDAERQNFYRGYSNEIIWPLFHGLPSLCSLGWSYWNDYCKVNAKFASVVEAEVSDDDLVWVHDYHLMLLAEALRDSCPQARLAYFHHIPFPPPDIFEKLPWRSKILRALLRFNALGFQTERDRFNFVACLRRWVPDVRISRNREKLILRSDQDRATVGAYPISIAFDDFAAEMPEHDVLEQSVFIKRCLAGSRIVLGVDRLDYTKGIIERLTAFGEFLRRHPEAHRQATLVQIVVPSREDIPEYQQLKLRIEMLVSKINGEYGSPGWTPIRYFYRSISRNELLAFYRAADVALVTPLKDGMNLVAKEFCAARTSNDGVLVLSEFAGAAIELRRGALLVNPYDIEQVVTVLRRALSMSKAEQRARMEAMRAHIRVHDVFHWARSFTADLAPLEFEAALA